jgi:hypothetical protein
MFVIILSWSSELQLRLKNRDAKILLLGLENEKLRTEIAQLKFWKEELEDKLNELNEKNKEQADK